MLWITIINFIVSALILNLANGLEFLIEFTDIFSYFGCSKRML